MENKDNGKNPEKESQLKDRSKTQIKKPSMYKVLMLNDDYTPMEFVVHIMKSYFKKSEPEAIQLMLQVHNLGFAVVGLYTLEVAEAKTHQVNEISKRHEYPLLTKFEKE